MTPPCVTVPRCFPDATIVCLASGWSLTDADVARARCADAVIAINQTYEKAPWASALYAADAAWWDRAAGAPTFTGLKYSVSARAAKWGVAILQTTGRHGLEVQPSGLRTGENSGYQAIGLAVHFGAKRIVLLGYDMQWGPQGEKHWHADDVNAGRRDPRTFLPHFQTLVQPLAAIGVEVINCTRRTALTCFPCRSLDDVLVERAA